MLLSDIRHDSLEHYGVLGMKWGRRKSDGNSAVPKSRKSSPTKDWTTSSSGEIKIRKGATISRVVRNNNGLFGGKGVSLDSGKPIYAAFKPVDTSAYEHFFGKKKGLLVKEASTVLKLQTKEALKMPDPKKATELYFDMVSKDPAAQKMLSDNLSGFAKAQLKKALAAPDSEKARTVYTIALDAGNYKEGLRPLNKKYYDEVKKAGYNALVDLSDMYMDFDTPIMVLDGEKSLVVKSKYAVDKITAEKARLSYKKEQASAGKTYLQSLGYA